MLSSVADVWLINLSHITDLESLPSTKIGDGMSARSKAGIRVALFGSIVLAIVAIYVFPFLATTSAVGATDVPPLFAPDLSLYLNLSNLQFTGEGDFIDPYYGIATHPEV